LKFANKLKSAGVLPEHAEAEAEALADIFEANLKEVATKEILNILKKGSVSGSMVNLFNLNSE
jgi:uncharacterized protein YjgD (DUF1641 family)